MGNAVAVDETYEQYSDLRAYLRSTTLSLSEEDSRDIRTMETGASIRWGAWSSARATLTSTRCTRRCPNCGLSFSTNSGRTTLWTSCFASREVMDGIYNVEEYNPFGPYMQQAITGAANEIMERFFDLPQTGPPSRTVRPGNWTTPRPRAESGSRRRRSRTQPALRSCGSRTGSGPQKLWSGSGRGGRSRSGS